MIKTILLAGASALVVAATAAKADTFSTPGQYVWTAPANGMYRIEVWGAQGGGAAGGAYSGGLGAGVWGEMHFNYSQPLYIFIGQQGGAGGAYAGHRDGAGGGGGASAALYDAADLVHGGIVAGGGGGAGLNGPGGLGRNVAAGGPGGHGFGSLYPGYGGNNRSPGGFGFYGGPGGGFTSNTSIPSAYFLAGRGLYAGGAGGSGLYGGGAGGSGWSGGGGALYTGGGGGGWSGGGGGGTSADGYRLDYGGGGGGSYVYLLSGRPQGSLTRRSGDGFVEILPLAAVPEPDEWMLLLMGAFSLGYLLRRQRERRALVAGA